MKWHIQTLWYAADPFWDVWLQRGRQKPGFV